MTVGPTIFNCDVPADEVAAFIETLAECNRDLSANRRAAEEPDNLHRRLLRPRRQRPSRSCAAEKGNEFAPFHRFKFPTRSRPTNGYIGRGFAWISPGEYQLR